MSEDILKDSWMPEGPVSKKIKDRIKKAGKRFHSNDNISEFIEDGEMDLLQAEVQEKLQGVLDSLPQSFARRQLCAIYFVTPSLRSKVCWTAIRKHAPEPQAPKYYQRLSLSGWRSHLALTDEGAVFVQRGLYKCVYKRLQLKCSL